MREEVLVDAAEHVAGTGVLVAHLDVADEVDQLAEPPLVEGGPGIVMRQHVLEGRVVALDRRHRLIDGQADGRLLRLRLELFPTGFRRDPEDVLGDVLVPILRGLFPQLGEYRRVALLEGVGDVLQEDQPEYDVLVLCGIH